MLAWPYLLGFWGIGDLRFRHLVGFDISGTLGELRGGLCVRVCVCVRACACACVRACVRV